MKPGLASAIAVGAIVLACEAEHDPSYAHPSPAMRAAISTPSPTGSAAQSADPNEPLRVSGDNVVAPQPIRRVLPDFSGLPHVHVLGTGVYALTITAKGTVADIHTVHSLGPRLDPIVLTALRKWKFRPATHCGRPMPVYFTVTVNFHT